MPFEYIFEDGEKVYLPEYTPEKEDSFFEFYTPEFTKRLKEDQFLKIKKHLEAKNE
jgi:hypothetical protein